MRELLTRHGAAELVTATASGLTATLLPFLYESTVGEHGALLGHLPATTTSYGPIVTTRGLSSAVSRRRRR